jgi:hypothetical protein
LTLSGPIVAPCQALAWPSILSKPYYLPKTFSESITMSIKSIISSMSMAVAVVAGLSLASPALAQDAFNSLGNGGQVGSGSIENTQTGTQTQQGGSANAPKLQGATNGTIAPQGQDATVIQGVNTAGTVRVNNLANLEALLNIIANGMEILGIAWGGPTMIMGFMHMAAGSHDAMKKVMFGAAGVTGGLATPGCINWLVASARDAALFN